MIKMNVDELIELLKTFPKHYEVKVSSSGLSGKLNKEDIRVSQTCMDVWIDV